MNTHTLLLNFLIFMGAAVITVPIATRLGLGSVLGYLIAGAFIGPWGLKLITNVSDILALSEFGIVLLLFIIGLELRPGRLWNMRRDIFGMGSLQIVMTMLALGIPLGLIMQFSSTSWIIAFGLSLSSTAFALQILREKHELNTQYGRSSFAILLFQDIAVIPAMIFLTLSAKPGNASLLSGVLPGALALLGILIFARYLIRPLFRLIAKTGIREIFTSAALLLVFSIALIMETAGFSMALGTFVAGVVLSESEYRHELEADIEPFKGLLLGLFFIAVGMSIDFSLIPRYPVLIPMLVLTLLVLKVTAVFIAGLLFRHSAETSRNIAFLICQGGEFAFVLFKLAGETGLAQVSQLSIATVVVAFSMAATPLMYLLNARILRKFLLKKPQEFDLISGEQNQVIIAGFGRYGQMIARILRVNDIDFTALELDSEQVEIIRKFGYKVYYGDAGRLDLLEAAGAAHAKIFVLAVDNPESSVQIAQMVKRHFPHLIILARARNRQHVYDLMDAGVDDIRRETMASGLETAAETLKSLGFSEKKTARTVAKFRKHDEDTLLEQYKIRHNEKTLISFSRQAAAQLTDVFRKDKDEEND